MKIQEYIEIVLQVNKSNHNDLSLIEKASLCFVHNNVEEYISWVNHLSKSKPMTKEVEEKVHILKKIEKCCSDILDTDLLKPVNGLVINRDRKRIDRILSNIKINS